MRRRAWKSLRALVLLAACVPAVLAARDLLPLPAVPFWDAWQFTDLIVRDRAGELAWRDLWVPHNEHRIPVAKLALLGLARLSGWDVRWEVAANLLLAGATLLALAHVARRTLAPAAFPWAVLAASVLLFSPAQWESQVWGWTMQIFLAQLCAALLAVCALHSRGRWRDLALELGVAAIGALSYGAALALLAVVPCLALLAPGAAPRRRRLAQAGVAVALAALFVALYVHGNPGPDDSLGAAAGDRRRGPLGFILTWLGAGTGALDPEVALGLGLAGVLTFALGAAWLWRSAPARRGALVPWIALALFALGAAELVAAGRLGYGYRQALIPRYVSLSVLFWIAWLAMCAQALAHLASSPALARGALAGAAALAGGVLAVAGSEQAQDWPVGREQIRERALLLEHGAVLLQHRARAADESLAALFHDGAAVRAWADELERLRLGPFQEGARAAPSELDLAGFELVRPERSAGQLEAQAPDRRLPGCRLLRGWAVDPADGGPVEEVLVTCGRQVIARARPTVPRPDVARFYGLSEVPAAGFEAHVLECAAAAAPDPAAGLRLFARLKGGRLVRLAGQPTLEPLPPSRLAAER